MASYTKLQISSNLKSHHLATRLTLPYRPAVLHSKQKVNRKITNVGLNARGRKPSGSGATESRRLQGEALKKSNEGVDLGAKRSETLIYIYFIYI